MLYIGSSVSSACKDTLKKLNIPFTLMPDCNALPHPVNSHPDMCAVKVCDKLFSSGEMATFFGCEDIGEPFGKEYPKDILFNGFTLGKRLFCSKKGFSRAATFFAVQNGFEIVNINQGYAKCSTLLLGEVGAITSDESIKRALDPFLKVLKIDAGEILLPPYDYGFIGGASFVLGKTVYFFGEISKHKNSKDILNFISELGFNAVSLSDEPLTDCGGAIWKDE